MTIEAMRAARRVRTAFPDRRRSQDAVAGSVRAPRRRVNPLDGHRGWRRCTTEALKIHGWTKQASDSPFLSVYGADAPAVQELATLEPALAEKIHPELPYIKAEVVWAAREEMARTVEDVLSRRTRGLLLGARASIEAAAVVADLLVRELGRDEAWKNKAVPDYQTVARGYVLDDEARG